MNSLIKMALIISLSLASAYASQTLPVESLTKSINDYENLANLYVQRAKCHIKEKRLEEAGIDLNKAVAINPKLEDAKIIYAYILIQQKRGDQARPLLESLITVSHDSTYITKAYVLLGDVYMLQDNTNEALKSYKKAFKITEQPKPIHYIKVANAYYELDLFKKSIETLKLGLSTVIPKAKLRESMVDLSMKEGNYTLALSVINTMINKNADDARLYYKKAQVLKAQGKLDEMDIEIKKAKLSFLKDTLNNDSKVINTKLYALL